MDGGMITSKKIVTLPLFYAALAKLIGMEADLLLYMIINVLVLGCSYYSCMLLFTKLTPITRGKIYSYWTVLVCYCWPVIITKVRSHIDCCIRDTTELQFVLES